MSQNKSPTTNRVCKYFQQQDFHLRHIHEDIAVWGRDQVVLENSQSYFLLRERYSTAAALSLSMDSVIPESEQ